MALTLTRVTALVPADRITAACRTTLTLRLSKGERSSPSTPLSAGYARTPSSLSWKGLCTRSPVGGSVIPAKAGIQAGRGARTWIPAFESVDKRWRHEERTSAKATLPWPCRGCRSGWLLQHQSLTMKAPDQVALASSSRHAELPPRVGLWRDSPLRLRAVPI